MAFKEIVVEESEGGEFFKFDAIGKVLLGRFQSHTVRPGEGMWDDGRPKQEENHYSFRTKNPAGEVVVMIVNAPTDLDRKLKAALKSGELKPNAIVKMTYAGDIPAKKAGYSPMKYIKTEIDDGPVPAAPAAAAKPQAKPPAPKPPPPAPAADPFDDIPL